MPENPDKHWLFSAFDYLEILLTFAQKRVVLDAPVSWLLADTWKSDGAPAFDSCRLCSGWYTEYGTQISCDKIILPFCSSEIKVILQQYFLVVLPIAYTQWKSRYSDWKVRISALFYLIVFFVEALINIRINAITSWFSSFNHAITAILSLQCSFLLKSKESRISPTLSGMRPRTHTPISNYIILLPCEICKTQIKFFRAVIRTVKSGWMTVAATAGLTAAL